MVSQLKNQLQLNNPLNVVTTEISNGMPPENNETRHSLQRTIESEKVTGVMIQVPITTLMVEVGPRHFAPLISNSKLVASVSTTLFHILTKADLNKGKTPASAIDLEKGLNTLADKLKRPAAGGGMLQMFASGAIAYGPGPRGSWPLYGYMQCTPDIRKEDCMKCLTDATNAIHNCCSKGRKLAAIV
ncbi:hypothetical protein SSX86_008759 [Deinandra increscens subsp. villosa]|uniref:Gnk2-homologous domain-containing protein n=1 Tax=Deinandra increscens subsp. villosa TaxID=3103831 RepID=A0AAP0DBX8_9ASTR